MATKPMPAPKPKEDPLDKGVYTVEKGPPPMPDEGPTKDIKPPKKYADGGPVLRPTVTDELRKAQFDSDIAQAKSGDTRNRAAMDRLATRGVDLPGLVRGRLPLEADNKGKENYKTGGSVSSRADGCAQRGKTRGMMR